MPNRIVFYLCGLLTAPFALAPVLAEELVTLDTRPGVTQSFLLLEPNEEPRGVILIFPGHEGVARFNNINDELSVEIERGGFTAREDTRRIYKENGLVVALIAAPSDMQGGMDTAFRSSDKHATDISIVLDYLNERYQKTPYIHGHCRSTFSPASIATKLNNRGISGLIMSSPRSQGRHGSITDYTKDVISTPVLLLQHVDDPCKGTPYRNLSKVRQFYESSSKKVDVIIVSGGDTSQTGPGSCQNGAHSFRGLEEETAKAIVNWVQGRNFQVHISD